MQAWFDLGIFLAVMLIPYVYIIARTVSSAYFKSKLAYNKQLSSYFLEGKDPGK